MDAPKIPDLSIRRLLPSDEGILQTLLGLFRTRERPEAGRLRSLLERHDMVIFAAFLRNQPIAWVIAYIIPRFSKDECFLYEIDVVVSLRRHGIATSLINALQDWANSQGIEEIFVLTEQDNGPAKGLYAGCGGKPALSPSLLFSWDLK